MTRELEYYKTTHTALGEKLKGAFVNRIIYSLDNEPTFDSDIVPFIFKYAFSVTLLTDRGDFKIFPTMTSEGLETFWTEQLEQVENSEEFEIMNSIVKAVHFGNIKGFDFPFNLAIEFDERELLFYCAEIYDEVDGTLTYKVNDEMILAFNDRQEAAKFDALIPAR